MPGSTVRHGRNAHLGHVLDRAASTTLSDIAGEALAVQRVLEKTLQPLALHGTAVPAVDPSHFQLQVNAVAPTRQIPRSTLPPVVPTEMNRPTGTANCFFPRRTRRMSRACGSPKIPWTVCRVRKPGNLYASARRRTLRALGIRTSCQNLAPRSYASFAAKNGTSAL